MRQPDKNPESDSLSATLERAAELLGTNPRAAETIARSALKRIPGQQQALELLVGARLAQGDAAGAMAMLEIEARSQPNLAALHYEVGVLRAEMGQSEAAIAALSRVVELEPDHPAAWRVLGDQLADSDLPQAAADAFARHALSAISDLRFLEGAASLGDAQLPMAEAMLNAFLEIHPTDVFAIGMLARTRVRQGRCEEAAQHFAHALELAPGFAVLRHDYVVFLLQEKDPQEALRQLDVLLETNPRDIELRSLKATALFLAGEFGEAIDCHEGIVADDPGRARAWLAYGQVLKTVGRSGDAIAAFRHAIKLDAGLGAAWWNLANLKVFRFTPQEAETIRAQLGREDIGEEDRLYTLFALGKALEDAEAYAESFELYRHGNELGRTRFSYDGSEAGGHLARFRSFFTGSFFASRTGMGCVSAEPIFVVGLPRSGSTLVEQILASHSAVEGTMELADIILIANRLQRKALADANTSYPEILDSLGADELESLGREYLARTRIQRKSARPFFVDKMPDNFQHIGLIQTILPNAKIIDVRRHPLGCGFSIYKHCFPAGMKYTFDLADIGRYYREYVEMMAHFDRVLPGRVHRIFYEALIGDPETEIRRLLAYCDLPFEADCLRFHDTERGVRTASSEQVRRPIYADAIRQWRHFERWLGPLRMELGPLLDAYPAARAQVDTAAR